MADNCYDLYMNGKGCNYRGGKEEEEEEEGRGKEKESARIR